MIHSRLFKFVFGILMSFSATGYSAEPVMLREQYLTVWDHSLDLDSLAVWHHGDQHWVVGTSKAKHLLVIYDATTGKKIDQIGKKGEKLGRFKRPNGIAILDHYVFVVERDNHRVQILDLLSKKAVAFFGSSDLIRPYGIAARKLDSGNYELWITDDYQAEDLSRRVKHYQVSIQRNAFSSRWVSSFGDSNGDGALNKVESIAVDPSGERLLIADEARKNLKVYTAEGKFTGIVLGEGRIQGDPEGIVSFSCGDRKAYWLLMDQNSTAEHNVISIFDQETFEYRGAFRGSSTTNTDGIVLTTQSFPGFEQGALFALNNDGGVSAFSWAEVLRNFQLCQ